LSRFDGVYWTTLADPESGLPSDHLSALALDGRGKLWVGTGATDRGTKEHAFRGWGLAVVDTATGRWERTFTFPQLTSNNVTDIVVHGSEVWVATAYFYYVDPRGGAEFSFGGGVSVYELDGGRWRKYGAAEGLAVAVRGRGAAQNQSLLDVRALHIAPDGAVWAGGLAYPGAAFAAGVVPDGVVDVIRPTGVEAHRFAASGGVVDLAADADGNLWAATELDGARVRVDGRWVEQSVAVGGLPADELAALSFDGGFWLGTRGRGLARLLPPAGSGGGGGGGIGPLPGGTPPGIFRHLPHKVYLPAADSFTGAPPTVIEAPGP
jgi:hypothetical protein